MIDPQRDIKAGNGHLERALERAGKLCEPRPAGTAVTEDWFAQASHFGDISVLALALRR
jgi:hypothetical protein